MKQLMEGRSIGRAAAFVEVFGGRYEEDGFKEVYAIWKGRLSFFTPPEVERCWNNVQVDQLWLEFAEQLSIMEKKLANEARRRQLRRKTV